MKKLAPLAPVYPYNQRFFLSKGVDPRNLVRQPVYSDWSIPARSLK